MRLLGALVLGTLTAAVVDCGGKSNSSNGNGTPLADGSVADAGTDAASDAAAGSGGSSGNSNGGSNSQGGEGDGGTNTPPSACPEAASDAFDLVDSACMGSDLCVYPNTHIAGECDGTFVTACTSGTWASQCFVGDASTPSLECTNLDGPDAGPDAMRVCSDSLVEPVLWGAGTLSSGVASCGPIPKQRGCQLPWGCGAFQTARINLAKCTGGALVHDQQAAHGWGYDILEDQLGTVVRRGYYDQTTGALVGSWVRQGLEETCAGTVPRLSLDDGEITGRVDLCLPDGGAIDGGTQSDGG
jgi:hypothetical protein